MYIDPYWLGVISTLAGEFLAVVIIAVVKNIRRKK